MKYEGTYNKAYQGAGGGGLGAALAMLTVWLMESNGMVVPAEVHGAIGIVLSFLGGLVLPILGPANR